MIDKVVAAGCLIVLAKMLILSQAIAEPVPRAPKEQDFFLIGFVSLCVGIVGFSNYLTLKQIWGDENFMQTQFSNLLGGRL